LSDLMISRGVHWSKIPRDELLELGQLDVSYSVLKDLVKAGYTSIESIPSESIIL
jgi:hypothetical protein